MQELLDSSEKTRREAATSLADRAEKTPHEIEPLVPEMLGYLRQSDDDMVRLGISSAIFKLDEKIPGTGRKYSTEIMETLDFFSSYEFTTDESDSLLNAIVGHLFNTQIPHLLTNSQLLTQHLPLIFTYLKKDGSVKWSAYRIFAQVSSENPRMFQDHIGEIIELVGKGNKELSASLLSFYQVKPDEFEEHMDTLIHIYKNDKDAKSVMSSLLVEISRKRPELLEPHIDLMISELSSPTFSSNASIVLGEIARVNPSLVHPHVSELRDATQMVDALKYQIPNILGLIGRSSVDVAREVLPFLSDLLKEADQNLAVMVLSEFRNLGEMDRGLLEPYMGLIQGFSDDPQEYVRSQAQLIIDYYEGRDFRSLAVQIEQQNAMIREAAVSVEALKEYVDKNVEMLKTFIADVAKKLPLPVKFSTEGRIRKTLQLYFVCGMQTERCIYPEDRPFITETKLWNKWLKIAISVVKIGKAIIFPVESGEILDQIREVYDTYKSEDETEFLTYIREPFLTSDEQDKLINQLRDVRFFDVFNYDPQTASWACLMCKPPRS